MATYNSVSSNSSQIKLALPSDGNEYEKYWAWTQELKPFMPPAFIKAFHKRSTARIRRVSGGEVKDVKDGGEIAGNKTGAKVCSVM